MDRQPQPNAASVAIIEGDRVLLIRRALAPYQNLWTFPGGRLEAGESIEDCARREVAEELGLIITELSPVLIETFGRGGQWRLAVYATTTFSGTPLLSDEIADWGWYRRDALAALRTTPGLDVILDQAFALFES